MRTRARRVRGLESPSLPQSRESVPGGNPALIAGYRVLRRLASSDRADLYVGVAPAPGPRPGRGGDGEETAGAPGPGVGKV
ncbi:MAG: hypothetical protein LH624_10555, partial [Cryobacterium sp.]|nr:hypothetical protein [Cryobacterium sp.]